MYAQSAKHLTEANVSRMERKKLPYIPVFSDVEQQDTFRQLLSAIDVSTASSTLRNERETLSGADLKSLAGLSPGDKLYVSGHGHPGNHRTPQGVKGGSALFGDDVDTFEEVARIARTLAKQLALPCNVEVRVSACWSAAGSRIEMPASLLKGLSGNVQKSTAYRAIMARRGDFSQSFAGSLEQHLIDLQRNRVRGSVSGYLGSITLSAFEIPIVCKTRDGGFEMARNHAVALFSVVDPSGKKTTIRFRRSDFRLSAQDDPTSPPGMEPSE
jgi:hypothetical protein